MRLIESQSRKPGRISSWSDEEELVIATIHDAESVPRPEAIRRMQRRRNASRLAVDRAWYAARLDDAWLLDFSIPIRRGDGQFLLAVPTAGMRRGGEVSFASLKSAEEAAERLNGGAGFANVRIERSRTRGLFHVVRWGDDSPIAECSNQSNGNIAEHKAAGKFFGYSDSAIRIFLLEHFGRDAVVAAERLCRNPKCNRGENGVPRSIAHLRADSLYCDNACRMAAQRHPSQENHASGRQYSCGSKAHNFGSARSPYEDEGHVR